MRCAQICVCCAGTLDTSRAVGIPDSAAAAGSSRSSQHEVKPPSPDAGKQAMSMVYCANPACGSALALRNNECNAIVFRCGRPGCSKYTCALCNLVVDELRHRCPNVDEQLPFYSQGDAEPTPSSSTARDRSYTPSYSRPYSAFGGIGALQSAPAYSPPTKDTPSVDISGDFARATNRHRRQISLVGGKWLEPQVKIIHGDDLYVQDFPVDVEEELGVDVI